MNKQRMVIYRQRREVLEGHNLREQMLEWIDEVIEYVVDNFTSAEYAEEWDLEGLVKAMEALYQTEITADELREDLSEITRETLLDEFRQDARDDYAAKEEELGSELMRELERFVVLQVVDQRWREHLENMDYLREGIHLRGMAQKDPLVEYTAEGHKMFEELGRAIREEVILHIFHAELAPEDAPALEQQPTNGRGNGRMQYEHEVAAGADVIAAAGAGEAVMTAVPSLAGAVQTVVASDTDKIGRNDPCWCGSGKKFKKCHGA
jgi:preprotein translocase subunit SecA